MNTGHNQKTVVWQNELQNKKIAKGREFTG